VGPAGTVEATGRSVTLPFVMIYRTNGESITGMRLYFDQMELLTQLGVIG
jgi:ketosteroid isomerase-like protein